MSEKWRIHELQQATAAALEIAAVDGELSRRVRAVPDARTIRYYTTIGLIDRPAEMRGRVAYYGRRHLLQLVCIKRLQAEGTSLAEVQQKLTGVSNQKLSGIANLRNGFWEQRSWNASAHSADESTNSDDRTKRSGSARRVSFWAAEAKPAANLQVSPVHTTVSVRLPIAANVSLEISGIDPSRLTQVARESLAPLLHRLAKTIEKFGLVPDDQPTPTQPHTPPKPPMIDQGEMS